MLAGGRRIVERLGPDDDEIEFQGTFSGPNAEARARAFDNLRLSGEIVWLTWDLFRRRIIVSQFIAEFHNPWWIPYKISCVVVHQTHNGSVDSTNPAAILSADLSNAMSAAAGSTISLSPIEALLSTSNALTSGTADQTNTIAALGSTLAIIDQQIEQQSTNLSSPTLAGTRMSDFGQSYISTVGYAASLATAVNVRSYVGRIAVNIVGSGA